MHLQGGLRGQTNPRAALEGDVLFEKVPAEDAGSRRSEDEMQGISPGAFGKAAADPQRRLGVGMRQHGAELARWIADGAHIAICGDASRMARDVETALAEILSAHGAGSMEAGRAQLQALRKDGRYQADVY